MATSKQWRSHIKSVRTLPVDLSWQAVNIPKFKLSNWRKRSSCEKYREKKSLANRVNFDFFFLVMYILEIESCVGGSVILFF